MSESTSLFFGILIYKIKNQSTPHRVVIKINTQEALEQQ